MLKRGARPKYSTSIDDKFDELLKERRGEELEFSYMAEYAGCSRSYVTHLYRMAIRKLKRLEHSGFIKEWEVER